MARSSFSYPLRGFLPAKHRPCRRITGKSFFEVPHFGGSSEPSRACFSPNPEPNTFFLPPCSPTFLFGGFARLLVTRPHPLFPDDQLGMTSRPPQVVRTYKPAVLNDYPHIESLGDCLNGERLLTFDMMLSSPHTTPPLAIKVIEVSCPP